jgi:polyisoprenoid-binding protein YceI
MKKTKLMILFSTFSLWMATCIFQAQGQTSYIVAPTSELKIVGKSNIRVWTLTSKIASGQGNFIMDYNQLQEIESLTVELQSESLKSGTKGLDKHAYETLKTGEFKHIIFTLTEFTERCGMMEAKGDFTIAGVTRQISFPVKVTQIGDQVNFQGEVLIKFSDFLLVTPTNFFGLIKTRDDATIFFNTTFKPRD